MLMIVKVEVTEACLYFLRAEVQNRLHQDQDYPCEVVGSWNTWYGEQDQAGKQQCSSKQEAQWTDNEKCRLLLIATCSVG